MGLKPRQRTNGRPDLRTVPKSQRPKPTSGQSGAPVEMQFADFNIYEQRVVRALITRSRIPLSVKELATSCKITPLAVRNSMRRLVRSGWVERATEALSPDGEVIENPKGYYRVTPKGLRNYNEKTKEG